MNQQATGPGIFTPDLRPQPDGHTGNAHCSLVL